MAPNKLGTAERSAVELDGDTKAYFSLVYKYFGYFIIKLINKQNQKA